MVFVVLCCDFEQLHEFIFVQNREKLKTENFSEIFCDFRHSYIRVYLYIEEGIFMNPLVCNNAAKKEETKAKLIEFMEQNNITYNMTECCGHDRFCVDFTGEENPCKKYCCNSGIVILTSNKDVCKIYPREILYIAIEKRKSVLYLTNGRVETNYPLDYWESILDLKIFAKPHNSFIVNLNYVDEITKFFVNIKCGDKEYSIYTSLRKIGAFKKAFLEFGEQQYK